MKILFVAPLFPLPAHSGGQIATLETLRSLHPFCKIDLLVPLPERDQEANQVAFRKRLPNIRLHFYPTRSPRRLAMYLIAARTMATGRSYWESSWYNPELRAAVECLHATEAYDAVHCEWLQPAVSLRGLELPLVIRTLDIHFIDMERWAETETDRLRRPYWRAQAQRFRRFEAETLRAAKTVVTLSAEDEAILRDCGVSDIVTIPPPRAVEQPKPRNQTRLPLALFVGRLDMAPNREAFIRFAEEIWPCVHEELRMRVRVVFAGGHPGEDLRQRADERGLEVHAPLSDADGERLFHDADLFLSPITSGTGIKVKTLDGMAHGKPMIGFRAAFRGVPVENTVHALIADTPADFARLFEQLVDDESRRHTIGNAARDLIRTNFDPTILGERLAHVYADVAQRTKP